jgi:large subunit ribosomal protein L6
MPIAVPPGVAIDIKGNEVTVSGPKGKLSRSFNREMAIVQEGSQLSVNALPMRRCSASARADANTPGQHERRHQRLDKNPEMSVGFMPRRRNNFLGVIFHPVEVEFARCLSQCGRDQPDEVSGIDKEVVGEMAPRYTCPLDPKGKGIRYTVRQCV